MRQFLTVIGFSAVLFLVGASTAMAQDPPNNVDCDPFSIACGYTIPVQIGPITIPIDHIFEPQP